MIRSRVVAAALLGALVVGAAGSAQSAASISNSLTGLTGDTSQPATIAALAGIGLNPFSTTGATMGTNNNGTPDDPTDDFPEVTSNDAIAFDAAGARFGSLFAGDGGRNYLRTNDSDYARSTFTAEVTVTVSDLPNQAIWFGMGAGDRALFGTPDWSTQFSSASFWFEENKIVSFRTANDVNTFVDTNLSPANITALEGAGTHRLRVTFDPVLNHLRGSIDIDYAGGPFVADASSTFPIVVTSLFGADGWPSEPSRIFFGADDGVIYSDLQITAVPEPSTFLVLVGSLAVAATLRRRA